MSNCSQILHKFKKNTKSSQKFEMSCHAAATDAEEGVASSLGWYSETWYCHMCCCCCCVGMSCYSCFIIIGDEVHNNKGFNDSVATMIHFGFQLPSDSRSWFNREQVVREEKSKIAFLIENCISLS